MKISYITQQIRSLAERPELSPSSEWKARNRSALLAYHIEEDISDNSYQNTTLSFLDKLTTWKNIFVPRSLVMAFRPLMSILIFLGLAVGGWMTSASAFYESIPGDFLWNVKLATEKTQIAFSGSEEKKTKLHVEFAGRRADETKLAVEQGNPDASKRSMDKLKESIESVDIGIRAVGEESPDRLVALVKDIDTEAQKITNTLNEAVNEAEQIDTKVVKQVAETNTFIASSTIQAAEVALQRVGGESAETVKEIVAKNIETAVAAVNEVRAEVNEAKLMASTTTPAFITSTPILSQTTSVSSSSLEVVADAEKLVEKSAVAVEQTATAVKTFVDNKQFFEAIQKVKELQALTSETSGVIADVKEATKPQQTAAPVPLSIADPAPVHDAASPTVVLTGSTE